MTNWIVGGWMVHVIAIKATCVTSSFE